MHETPNEKTPVAIWWVKRDFRLNDNEAFSRALTTHDVVLPMYLFEPLVMNGPDWGAFHTQAIQGAAQSLSKNLNHFNSKLLIFESSPIDAIDEINHKIAASGFEVKAIYSHEETGLTHTFERDKALKIWCQTKGIVWHEFTNNGVIRGSIDRDYWEKRFVDYMTTERIKFPKNKLLESFPERLKSILLERCHISFRDESFASEYMNVSERSGNLILRDFLSHRGRKYRGGISSMNRATDACSRLSAQIAWGALSLRTVFQECGKQLDAIKDDNVIAALSNTPMTSKSILNISKTSASETSTSKTSISKTSIFNANTRKQWNLSLANFRSRLFWHAHFVQKLENQVDMECFAVNEAFRTGLPYIDPESDVEEHNKRLQAWLYGQTGFPAIDAAMRYYQKFGWLNFRSRAMITSFACNALRLPWQTVLYALSKLMIDYVPGIHVSQVQMQAGVTGINTIRVYSPQKQLQDHDPKCTFVYSMIPELRTLKPAQIFSLSSDFSTGKYTKPIIDFKKESKIMKDALYAISKSDHCAVQAKKVFVKHGSRRRSFSRQSASANKSNKHTSPQLKLF